MPAAELMSLFFSPLIRKRAMKHKLSLQRTSPALLPDFYFQSQQSANIHYPQNPKTSSNRNMRVAFRAERKYSASWVTACPLVRPSAAQPTGSPPAGAQGCQHQLLCRHEGDAVVSQWMQGEKEGGSVISACGEEVSSQSPGN